MSPRAVALVLAVLAAACGDSAPAAPASATPPGAIAPHLEVDVERSRSAAGRGVIEIVLSTAGEEPLEVTRVQFLDPRFVELPPEPKSTLVRPSGRRVVTPFPAPEVVCDVTGDGGDPRVALTVRTAAGEEHALVLPVAAPGSGMLARLHTETCRRRALDDAVSIAFGREWTRVGPATATGRLRLERRSSDETVVVEDLQGTVIFTLRVLAHDGGGMLTLPAGVGSADVPVEVSAARCDPHALIESKKTYLFPTWVRLGDDPTLFLTVEPEGAARRALEDLLKEGCFGDQA